MKLADSGIYRLLSHPLVRLSLWLGIPIVIAASLVAVKRSDTSHNARVAGGCPATSNSFLEGPALADNYLITYCAKGDLDELVLKSTWMPQGTRRIDIRTSGYGEEKGQTLSLVGASGKEIAIPLGSSAEHWSSQTVIVPKSLSREKIQIILRDRSRAFQGWAGLGILGYSALAFNPESLAKILAIILLMHLAGTLTTFAISLHFDSENSPILALIALGLLGYIAVFCTYFFGKYGAYTLSTAYGIILIGAILARASNSAIAFDKFNSANRVFLPVAASTLLVSVIALYPFPIDWGNWQYSANRWLSLPMDTWLPRYFADQLWARHVTHPMIGDWLSSDRPPLQTGFYLLFKAISERSAILYLISSAWLQSTCLVPIFFIAKRLAGRANPAPVVAGVALSSIILINSIFVWPKLIAATYCGIAYLALFCRFNPGQQWKQRGLTSGLGSALAMLSHGGAAFALIATHSFFAFQKQPNKWRTATLIAVTALSVYLPWTLYQKLADPPGTRLIAWQLAGVQAVDPRPLGTILAHAYGSLSASDWIQGRYENAKTILQGSLSFFESFAHLLIQEKDSNRALILNESFFYLFYSQWFISPLIAIPLALLGRQRIGQIRDIAYATAITVFGLAFWIIVMFSPRSTIIHQGAYFIDLLSLAICSAIIWRFSKKLFITLLSLNVAVVFNVFVLSPRVDPAKANPQLPHSLKAIFWDPKSDHTYLAICILVLAIELATILLCYKAPQEPSTRSLSSVKTN